MSQLSRVTMFQAIDSFDLLDLRVSGHPASS